MSSSIYKDISDYLVKNKLAIFFHSDGRSINENNYFIAYGYHPTGYLEKQIDIGPLEDLFRKKCKIILIEIYYFPKNLVYKPEVNKKFPVNSDSIESLTMVLHNIFNEKISQSELDSI